jgi:hypothetical protein
MRASVNASAPAAVRPFSRGGGFGGARGASWNVMSAEPSARSSTRMPDMSPSRIAWFSLLLSVVMAGTSHAADPPPDPAVTVYGTLNPAAPAELGVFSFLVGKWTGTGTYRDPEGKPQTFGVLWIGRYALNGMAIADEIRRPEADGAGIDGLTLRFFDPTSKTWTVEFLNFARSFLRKQANASAGRVVREGKKVTVFQSGPAGKPGREVYTVVDDDHFTYSMDVEEEGGWDEGVVTMKLERQE